MRWTMEAVEEEEASSSWRRSSRRRCFHVMTGLLTQLTPEAMSFCSWMTSAALLRPLPGKCGNVAEDDDVVDAPPYDTIEIRSSLPPLPPLPLPIQISHFCVIFVSFFCHFSVIFVSFLCHYGVKLSHRQLIFCVIFCVIFVSLWCHFGVIMVSLWCHYGVILVSFF